jgi:hypothetical protein
VWELSVQRKKFPVIWFREFEEKRPFSSKIAGSKRVRIDLIRENSLYFPAYQGNPFGDGFAEDCLHHHALIGSWTDSTGLRSSHDNSKS